MGRLREDLARDPAEDLARDPAEDLARDPAEAVRGRRAISCLPTMVSLQRERIVYPSCGVAEK